MHLTQYIQFFVTMIWDQYEKVPKIFYILCIFFTLNLPNKRKPHRVPPFRIDMILMDARQDITGIEYGHVHLRPVYHLYYKQSQPKKHTD